MTQRQTAAVVVKTDMASVAKRIDDLASGAMALFQAPGSFADELAVAQTMTQLREALTPEVMAPIIAMMNTNLGFRTDKDPRLKDREGRPNVPYPMEVVRECFIESKLRGFHTVGNEWN